MLHRQVGGRPLSAVTPEKLVDTSSSGAMTEDESAQLLREAGDMSPDLTMKSIVEVSKIARCQTWACTHKPLRQTRILASALLVCQPPF